VWRETTSTRGGRVAIAIAAGAVACLLLFAVAMAGFMLLSDHGDSRPMGRQGGMSHGEDGERNGRGPGDGMRPQNRQDRQDKQDKQGGLDGQGGRAQGLPGLGSLGAGAVLHGSLSADVDGSVQSLLFQRGEVTAVSATSITLKSSDGFVGTYVLNAEAKANGSAVKAGQAFVLARASDKVVLRTMVRPAQKAAGS